MPRDRDKQIAAAAVQDGNGPVRGREGRHTLYVKQRLVAGKEQVEGSMRPQTGLLPVYSRIWKVNVNCDILLPTPLF
ncbi:unnamed protein product [Arctogadus glacialis]